MIIRHLYRLLLLLPLLATFVAQPVDAQQPRRWVADPAIHGGGQGLGRADMELVDSRTGWATVGNTVYRFDGRYWRPDQRFDTDVAFFALDMASPTSGWAGGAVIFRTSAGIRFARYDGRAWQLVTDIVTKDGRTTQYPGVVFDIAAFPDGTALALAFSYPHTLVLRYDGTAWRDETPESWGPGGITQLSMISPTEGWAAGTFDIPNTNGRRPAVFHLKNGVWTEEALPAFEANGIGELTMTGANEGWGVWAKEAGPNDICDTSRLLHYLNGSWTLVPLEAHSGRPINAFELIPGTNRGWASLGDCSVRNPRTTDLRARFDNGAFTLDGPGAQLSIQAFALLNDEVQYAVAGTYFLRYTNETLPTERVSQQSPLGNGSLYFTETGHNVYGRFQAYYQTHGLDLGDPGTSARESLGLFGYPLSEPFVELNPDTGELLEVQYFERARMEFHPGNRDPYRVLLGRLTVPVLGREGVTNTRPTNPAQAGCNRYAETGYDLCPPFRSFWNANGGLAVFGFPITQAQELQSRTDGRTYLTQYFERERLEYHPELRGTPYEVLLGLLGAEELRIRGYLP